MGLDVCVDALDRAVFVLMGHGILAAWEKFERVRTLGH